MQHSSSILRAALAAALTLSLGGAVVASALPASADPPPMSNDRADRWCADHLNDPGTRDQWRDRCSTGDRDDNRNDRDGRGNSQYRNGRYGNGQQMLNGIVQNVDSQTIYVRVSDDRVVTVNRNHAGVNGARLRPGSQVAIAGAYGNNSVFYANTISVEGGGYNRYQR